LGGFINENNAVPGIERPRPLQSTRTGQAMRRPARRSSTSWSWSTVAAARYSSQMACTWSGSRSASIYASRACEPNACMGEPQPPSASSTTASGAAESSRSGNGSGCANRDHGQNAQANSIEREAIGDEATTIMPGHRKACKAKVLHYGDHVVRHGPFGIGRMVRPRGGTAAAAIATQIGTDHRETASEQGSDLAPHHMRLRKAVQQKHRRPRPEAAQKNLGLVRRHFDGLELLPPGGSCHRWPPLGGLPDVNVATTPPVPLPITGNASVRNAARTISPSCSRARGARTDVRRAAMWPGVLPPKE